MLTIIRGEWPPIGVPTLPVPFALGNEPTDAEIQQGYKSVRDPAGRAWVCKNSKCGYVCYEQKDKNAAQIARWALEED